MTEEAPEVASEATLKQRIEELLKERSEWEQERSRLREEVELLRSRVTKLSKQDGTEAVARSDAQTQTEPDAEDVTVPAEQDGLPGVLAQMLRSPQDETLQLSGIEQLFVEQTQAGAAQVESTPQLHQSLEVAVAIFHHHQNNWTLLLKASQFLSVLLAEPSAQQLLPQVQLQRTAQAVLAASCALLEKTAGLSSLASQAGYQAAAGAPGPQKLFTWLLSLLSLLLPSLETWLRQRPQSEAFVHSLMHGVVSRLLAASELPSEALILKSVQLLPLLPMESWIQQMCLESGAIHSFALVRQRLAEKKRGESGDLQEVTLAKAVQSAIRSVFCGNLELCSWALSDAFVGDSFVCIEVLEELQSLELQRRGTFRRLEADFDIISKVMSLWAFHQRQTLEDSEPAKSSSLPVLKKAASLLQGVLVKLLPGRLLERLEEFQESEVLVRIALAAVHHNAQLRLQLAVNYADNNVIAVMVACMVLLLRGYETEGAADAADSEVEVAFQLLADDKLPADGWSYTSYCLDVCLHVLSHWSCTKLAMPSKGPEVLDPSAAPVKLASAGVVDVLAEVIDAPAAGVELRQQPPTALVQKACETLQALFERNGQICLFCMKHYAEVKQIILVGCESIVADPLSDHPEMQQEAIELFVGALEKFATKDERLSRKLLKALTVLFESSYQLVAWFLQEHPLSSLSELNGVDAHIEAVRAVSRAGYWSSEDAPLLPEFVAALVQTMLDAVEGHLDFSKPPSCAGRRVVDLTEAEEIASSCMASILHLMLIDPRPPMVQQSLARTLGQGRKVEPADSATAENTDDLPPLEDVTADDLNASPVSSEEAVNTMMKIMQVFPSSDRLQMNCQHILTSLLGE